MQLDEEQKRELRLGRILWNLLLMVLGCLLVSVSVNGLLIPHHFVAGGFTGLALLLHYLWPPLNVGLVYLAFNVPLYIWGWRAVGRRFFIYSVAGALILSAALELQTPVIALGDPMLAALLAGLLVGGGSGLALRSLGSAGGTDILSIILLKRFGVRLGSTVLVFNLAVLASAAFLFPLERVLHTLVFLFVSSHVMGVVVTGLSVRKSVHIISRRHEAITRAILEQIKRGATLIPARGAYTGLDENIIYTVVTFRELARLKEITRRLDPEAFMVVSDTLEVMGMGVGNQPHW